MSLNAISADHPFVELVYRIVAFTYFRDNKEVYLRNQTFIVRVTERRRTVWTTENNAG